MVRGEDMSGPGSGQTFLSERIAFAEELLEKYGAELVGTAQELETVAYTDGTSFQKEAEKRLWKRGKDYIRVDKMFFTKGPFIVLEFSDRPEGPYEDADPFPCDLPDDGFEAEIRFALGVDLERFLGYMRTQGCAVETGPDPPLPKWITDRYHSVPGFWLQFIGQVRELSSPDETTWFLCAEDYDTRLDHTWRWNEWEELSLQSAEGDDAWRAEIRAFWDDHLPIVLSVRDGYAYYAISMTDGSVVYGSEPEFEECEMAAGSFAEFLERIMDGTIPF